MHIYFPLYLSHRVYATCDDILKVNRKKHYLYCYGSRQHICGTNSGLELSQICFSLSGTGHSLVVSQALSGIFQMINGHFLHQYT